MIQGTRLKVFIVNDHFNVIKQILCLHGHMVSCGSSADNQDMVDQSFFVCHNFAYCFYFFLLVLSCSCSLKKEGWLDNDDNVKDTDTIILNNFLTYFI